MQLLYVDMVNHDVLHIPRTRPTICHWGTDQLKFRETFEKENIGSFGIGELNQPLEYNGMALNLEVFPSY